MALDIEVDDITKSFMHADRRVTAVQGVSLKVERGSLFAVVGPSGCGKSTLLRLILGLTSPDKGKLWLDPERKKQGTAYIQQSNTLLPWRTALQNVALGIELKEKITPGIVQGLREEFERFGLKGFENSLVSELSGGMQQRVTLLRALVSRPAILFCDEPFSAIDFVTRLELNTEFKKMSKLRGITTILVTHNIDEAIFLGDRVGVMSGRPGRIIKQYCPKLSIAPTDSVESRKSPEFNQLFEAIWRDLRSYGR